MSALQITFCAVPAVPMTFCAVSAFPMTFCGISADEVLMTCCGASAPVMTCCTVSTLLVCCVVSALLMTFCAVFRSIDYSLLAQTRDDSPVQIGTGASRLSLPEELHRFIKAHLPSKGNKISAE